MQGLPYDAKSNLSSTMYYRDRIQGSIWATWALALVAFALRITARRISKAGFWWDDWLLIPAMVLVNTLLSTQYTDSVISYRQQCSALRRPYAVSFPMDLRLTAVTNFGRHQVQTRVSHKAKISPRPSSKRSSLTDYAGPSVSQASNCQ